MKLKSITFFSTICLLMLNAEQLNAQNNDYSLALNRYSFDLYNKVKNEKENLILSPLSTYYTLLMAYEGSKKETKAEFEKILSLKSSNLLQQNYLRNLVNTSDGKSGFNFYNAIWLDNNLHVKNGYKKSVEDKYLSDFKRTEFANTESTVLEINDWVSEKTNHKINKIVSAENLTQETKLLISNAVYFNAEWLYKFKKRMTYNWTFFSSIENQYKIDFMKKKEVLQYFENEDFQFISKPYKSSNMSFCILLPKKLFNIEEIEKMMNNMFFQTLLDSSYYAKVFLKIPKLKLESNYELSDALKSAGLKSAFTKEADFSGITKEKPTMLHQVLHKTWIELDEEKTVAAAASATIMKVGYARQDACKIFNADHPFVFFIVDNSNKSILFMGRYVKPTRGEKIVEEKESLASKADYRQGDKFEIGDQSREILYVVNEKIVSQTEFKAINSNEIEKFNTLDNPVILPPPIRSY